MSSLAATMSEQLCKTLRLSKYILPALLLAACAPLPTISPTPVMISSVPAAGSPEFEALRNLIALQSRIDRVTGPLLVNNPELCKRNARKLLGFSAKNKYSFSTDLAELAQRSFGFNDRLQVTNVLAGSGAAKSGVMRGDILISVEDTPVPEGQNAERQAAAVLGPLVQTRSDVKLRVMRGNENLVFNIPLTMSCAFSVELGNADHVNAYSDGRRIVITRGLVNATKSDEELAFVIAKEMAHNVFGHAAKQRMTATMGGIIDNLIRVQPDLESMTGRAGVTPFPQELDAEADRLGLFMSARAGFPVQLAAGFWRQFANQFPVSVLNGYNSIHPATAYRLTIIDRTIADIASRQSAGRPLLP